LDDQVKAYINEKIKDIFLILYGLLIWVIGYFIPIKKGRWVFGAIRGCKYIDNTRHLFEFSSGQGIDCAWVARTKDVVQHVRSMGYRAHNFYSIKGLWYVMTSEAAFFTHRGNLRNGDLPFYAMSKNTYRVQTWHGIPLKKIAYDDKIFSYKINEKTLNYKIRRIIEGLVPYLRYVKRPDLILALSEETKSIFSGAFRVPPEKVEITGYPRNDRLFSSTSTPKNFKKVIYMPTFRGGEGYRFDPLTQYGFDLDCFQRTFKRSNSRLYIKLHPFNLPSKKMLNEIENSDVVSFLWDEDIYCSLKQYDILVTDYSSVYFDFLLLGKPIIFTPFDYNSYLRFDRELYYSYDEVTPGPKAYDWNGFLKIIDNIDGFYDEYAEEAHVLKKRFHKYDDAESSARVVAAVLGRLQR
jgi:CDP-glycerol glycerophosphotransferase